MDSVLNDELYNPESLKTLASCVANSDGNTLLHQFVLDNSDPNTSGSESYINAVLKSMSNISVHIINALNKDGYSALHLAVMKNNFLMVKKILSCLANTDINHKCHSSRGENTALHLATQLGHISIIQELLRKGAETDIKNMKGKTALHFAVKLGDLDVMRLLISKGACVNPINRQPLHYAAKLGNLEAVKLLVSSGANVNKNEDGWTPLFYALGSGHQSLELVKFLVHNGADVNATNGNGFNPIFCAMDSDHHVLELIELLISNGADVNAKDKDGRTPLLYALRPGHLTFQRLKHIVHSRKLNRRNYEVFNPIICAKESDPHTLALIELLISKGADVNAKDKAGCTPLFHAIHSSRPRWQQKQKVAYAVNVISKYKSECTPLFDKVVDDSKQTDYYINMAQTRGSFHYISKAPSGFDNSEFIKILVKNGAYVNA